MSKELKATEIILADEHKDELAKEESFEMIELAIDDLEVLSRAFNLISEACQELDDPKPRLAPPARITIN